ncbi:MAG: hypothetical protein HY674_03150 [Chloroflexi bacterium]|nr:hypothetical protein [Chloroflexota bacterium]
MSDVPKNKGPWLHRFMVLLFTLLLALLVSWLLGFFMRDIASLPAPAWSEVEKQFLDESLLKTKKELDQRLAETGRTIKDQQERQALLRDSAGSSQRTMGQLLDVQKLSLEKGVSLSEAEQKALSESKDLFLSNQKRYQVLNEDIARLKEEERSLQEQNRGLDAKLESQRAQARQEHSVLLRRHAFKIATLKLLVLVPLLAVAVLLFFKKRSSLYAPFIYASGAALLWRIGLVIHEQFPARLFKYILLLAALAVVAQLLIYLLRMMAFPKKEWLLKQYREAYEKFACPICGYPIRRGPLKYAFWTQRTIKKSVLPPAAGGESDEPYTCPSCGCKLFEKCEVCQAVRHSLLPACEKCGAEKEPAASPVK